MIKQLQSVWHWWEKYWRVPRTRDNGFSRQKFATQCLAALSLVLAITASYFAARLQLERTGALESTTL